MTRERRALLVCPDFPPVVGGHVQPLVKLVKYLAPAGWRVTVLTQSEDTIAHKDYSALADVPTGTRIVRTANADPLMRLWVQRRQATAGAAPATNGAAAPATQSTAPDRRGPVALAKAALRPLAPAVHAFFKYAVYVPDELTPWVPGAIAAGRRIIREERPAVVMSTCPAYTAHLVGLALQRASGLPWVADFRDLWVGRPYRRVLSRLHTRWELVLERQVVRRATRLVVASPVFTRVLADRYGSDVETRTTWVSNGYDPADYADPAPRSPRDEFRIVYTGAMFDAESPVPFLEALGRVRARMPSMVAPVRMSLAGIIGDEERRQADGVIGRYGLEGHVSFLGVRSHAECVELQRGADLLLLVSGPGHTDNIRTKSIEYLATGRPILSMLPLEGIQAEIYKRVHAGPIVPPDDIEGAAQALTAILTRHRGGDVTWQAETAEIEKFDYRVLGARLAAVCDDLA